MGSLEGLLRPRVLVLVRVQQEGITPELASKRGRFHVVQHAAGPVRIQQEELVDSETLVVRTVEELGMVLSLLGSCRQHMAKEVLEIKHPRSLQGFDLEAGSFEQVCLDLLPCFVHGSMEVVFLLF